jgi:hypothetical protein
VQDTLAATCPHPGWTLCADIAQLPHDNDEFLWNPASPIWRNGDFFRLEDELGEIVGATLARHWPRVLANAATRAARQFVSVAAGDGTDSRLARGVTIRFGIVLGPEVEAAIRAGRQVREEPATWLPARLPGPIALGAMAALAALLLLARPSRPALIALAAALFAAAAANALAVGLGSAVHDRYQARIAWLFPFALVIALAASRPAPAPAPAYASRT